MPSAWSSDVCRSEEHTSELQSHDNLVCRLLLEKKKINTHPPPRTPHHPPPTAQRRCWARAEGAPSRRDGGVMGCARRHTYDSPLFFFNDTATTEIYTLSLHDALPI